MVDKLQACYVCGEPHSAYECALVRCFNCNRPGHRSDVSKNPLYIDADLTQKNASKKVSQKYDNFLLHRLLMISNNFGFQ